MKMTMTQAWEATGLTGVALRMAVDARLQDKYIKEQDPKTTRLYALLWAAVLFLGIGTYVIAARVMPLVARSNTDFNVTSNALAFIGVTVLLMAFFLTAYAAGIKLVQTYRKMPYMSRYMYQNRDTEVEL